MEPQVISPEMEPRSPENWAFTVSTITKLIMTTANPRNKICEIYLFTCDIFLDFNLSLTSDNEFNYFKRNNIYFVTQKQC